MSEKKTVFAVAGRPILHSLSPAMFNSVFLSEGINAVYTRILGERVEEVIEIIKQVGIEGINVTSPFKEEILSYIDVVGGEAKIIGAVNTVRNIEGVLYGFNTDIYSIEMTLEKRGIKISNKKTVVIGAGGAARAACFFLKSKGADVTIINRTYNKAADIARNFNIKALSVESLNNKTLDADILILCLPRDTCLIYPDSIKKSAFVIDANYSVNSKIINGAKKRGYKACDGKDWLLYQAIESFKTFTGQTPPVHIMERVMGKELIDGNKLKNIALVGFMGAGKSSVGKYLSEYTGFEVLETDSIIEERTGLSIKEIFKTRGESFFRTMEEEAIEEFACQSRKIISCGGGSVISEKNRDVLRKNSIVIWLWAKPETIFKRIVHDKTRPLMEGIESINKLKSMINKRIPFYVDVTDVIVSTDNKNLKDIARLIYEETKRFIKN